MDAVLRSSFPARFGGDDALGKSPVRAGALRGWRPGGSGWWRRLARTKQWIARRELDRAPREV
jgi:hypothetical protein